MTLALPSRTWTCRLDSISPCSNQESCRLSNSLKFNRDLVSNGQAVLIAARNRPAPLQQSHHLALVFVTQQILTTLPQANLEWSPNPSYSSIYLFFLVRVSPKDAPSEFEPVCGRTLLLYRISTLERAQFLPSCAWTIARKTHCTDLLQFTSSYSFRLITSIRDIFFIGIRVVPAAKKGSALVAPRLDSILLSWNRRHNLVQLVFLNMSIG